MVIPWRSTVTTLTADIVIHINENKTKPKYKQIASTIHKLTHSDHKNQVSVPDSNCYYLIYYNFT